MNNHKIYIAVLLLCGVMASCKKDNPGDVENIPGLGGDTWAATSIDKWIADTLTATYNVSAKYRWDQGELAFDRTLTPPSEEKIIPVLSSIKKVWIDTYVAEAGSLFMKKYIPKFFILVGSASWNTDGTITLGTAEGGREIILYVLNDFRAKGMTGYVPSDSVNIKEMFHTIEHEFGHILHQTVYYPVDFKQVSVGDYTSNWNNTTDKQANEKGFVTAYAQSAYDEDFVETISTMLVEGKAGFDKLVNGINSATARAKIRQKEAFVVTYYKNVWNIDFYSLQARTYGAIQALIK
jgi:substrate import-associated zinc metallohydrolase lipoprotein